MSDDERTIEERADDFIAKAEEQKRRGHTDTVAIEGAEIIEQLAAPKLSPDRGVQLRYVAGLAIKDGAPSYGVWVLYEVGEWTPTGPQPTRVGIRNVIPELTTAQAEHLWMQLGKALGKPEAFE